MKYLVCVMMLAAMTCGVHSQGVRSPLLQVWGVNLAGTRRLAPDEVWGVGLDRVQQVAFDPDEGHRLRNDYQQRFGTRGQDLINMLGKGKHVDEVARNLSRARRLKRIH